jgi:prepilin-type processing-associated H-X9-DG protein
VALLPYVEQDSLYRSLKADTFNLLPPDSGSTVGIAAQQLPLLKTSLSIYLCPSDPGTTAYPLNDNRPFSAIPGVSGTVLLAQSNYAANNGNLTGTGTNFVFNAVAAGKKGVSLDEIVDGTSQTICIGERTTRLINGKATDADTPPQPMQSAAVWAGFYNPACTICNNTAIYGWSCYRMQDGYHGTSNNPAPKDKATNAAWSSTHTGGANFVLCDGSVRFINQNVDFAAYVDGKAPLGTYNKLGAPNDGQPIGDF